MNRNLSSALAMGTVTAAAVSAVAAIASRNARADDITVDLAPFVSTRSRAEAQAELVRQLRLIRRAGSEWAFRRNPPSQLHSALARQQPTPVSATAMGGAAH